MIDSDYFFKSAAVNRYDIWKRTATRQPHLSPTLHWVLGTNNKHGNWELSMMHMIGQGRRRLHCSLTRSVCSLVVNGFQCYAMRYGISFQCCIAWCREVQMWWDFLQVCEDIGGHMQAQPRRRSHTAEFLFWLVAIKSMGYTALQYSQSRVWFFEENVGSKSSERWADLRYLDCFCTCHSLARTTEFQCCPDGRHIVASRLSMPMNSAWK